MAIYYNNWSYQRIPPDPSIKDLVEILWSCHPIQRSPSAHPLCNGYARVWDSTWRAHVQGTRWTHTKRDRVKLADDLYCGINTPTETTWQLAWITLCSTKVWSLKTVIAPKQISVLGWIWKNGTISASPHRISTLASCDKPTNVTGMPFFLLGLFVFLVMCCQTLQT